MSVNIARHGTSPNTLLRSSLIEFFCVAGGAMRSFATHPLTTSITAAKTA